MRHGRRLWSKQFTESFVGGAVVTSAPVSAALPERVEVPPHVPAELVHWVDHHNDDVVKADPIGFMDPLRERFRVFYSPAYEGFWAVTRYADQREVFQRHDLFSSDPIGLPGGPGYGGHKLLPIGLDPPEHTKYRALINPVFAPKRVRALEEKARALSVRLIEDILDSGASEIDFIGSYAEKYPTQIFVDMLGIPFERYHDFLRWNNDLLHVPPVGDGLAVKQRAGEDINEYLTQLIDRRSKNLGDDLVSTLLTSEVDGQQLSRDEVLRATFLLFMAGLDTVMSAHGWVWHWLALHPVERQSLIDDPALLDGAIEELLRVMSFANSVRTVRMDIEFAGVQMKKGDRVWLHASSASRDPREFPNPATVDFRRAPNRHLAFAGGPHRCVGSHLARLELKVSLQEWHKRLPEYRIPDGAEVPMHCGGVAGISRLPLQLAR
jgi:cytochrome P450